MTSPEPSKAPAQPAHTYLVFTPGGGFCMAHTGPEAPYTASSHASVLNGFVLKFPIHEDFREYKR